MLIAKKYEIPDNCKGCPWFGDPIAESQGGICFRCPVMNCTPPEDDPLGYGPPIEPEHYREDWARIFCEWFKGDRKEWPNLPLVRKER